MLSHRHLRLTQSPLSIPRVGLYTSLSLYPKGVLCCKCGCTVANSGPGQEHQWIAFQAAMAIIDHEWTSVVECVISQITSLQMVIDVLQ